MIEIPAHLLISVPHRSTPIPETKLYGLYPLKEKWLHIYALYDNGPSEFIGPISSDQIKESEVHRAITAMLKIHTFTGLHPRLYSHLNVEGNGFLKIEYHFSAAYAKETLEYTIPADMEQEADSFTIAGEIWLGVYQWKIYASYSDVGVYKSPDLPSNEEWTGWQLDYGTSWNGRPLDTALQEFYATLPTTNK